MHQPDNEEGAANKVIIPYYTSCQLMLMIARFRPTASLLGINLAVIMLVKVHIRFISDISDNGRLV